MFECNMIICWDSYTYICIYSKCYIFTCNINLHFPDSSPKSTNNRSGGVPITSSSSSSSSASSSVFGLCTSVSNFRKLSRIGEGTYGYVYKACVIQSIDSASNNISETSADESKGIVALKRIKMHNEHQDGFPLTCLREIKTLRRCSGHENIVALLDIVVGRNRDAVFLLFEYCEHDLVRIFYLHNYRPCAQSTTARFMPLTYLFVLTLECTCVNNWPH